METSFIPAEWYRYIYLFFLTILSIPAVKRYADTNQSKNDNRNAIFICILLALFLGTRPLSDIFNDMPLYYGIYTGWSGTFTFDWTTTNLLFDNLEYFLASIRFDPILHYILFAFIYFGCILAACKKLFPNHITFSFLCYCMAFSTFDYCVNGYKAGSAAAFFLVAIAFLDKKKIAIPFALLSLGFHHSMQIPVIALLLSLIFKKDKWYFGGWFFCALMAILHVGYFQVLFTGFADEKAVKYLTGDMNGYEYMTGFRPDFLLYSAMPIVVGYIAKYKKHIQSKMYDILFHTYIVSNGVWLLCMYASFTNRIAYLSWLLYPIVLIYPITLEEWGVGRVTVCKKVFSYHMLFTLFMFVMYYGLIKSIR